MKLKLIIELNNTNITKKKIKEISCNDNIAGFLIGIKNLSLDPAVSLTVDKAIDIITYLHKLNQVVYINIMRLFHQDELNKAIECINKLPLNKNDYILFGDLGLFMRIKEQYQMIYYAPTYLTNKYDIIMYQSLIGNVIISNQISFNELIDIIDNLNDPNRLNNIPLFIQLFGQEAIFYSKRPLLTNYFKYMHKNNNPYLRTYTVQEEIRDKFHPIIEDGAGFHLYEWGHYNLISEMTKLEKVDYGLIRTFNLNKEETDLVIYSYLKVINKQITIDEALSLMTKSHIPLYKGAYDFKTVLLKKEVDDND